MTFRKKLRSDDLVDEKDSPQELSQEDLIKENLGRRMGEITKMLQDMHVIKSKTERSSIFDSENDESISVASTGSHPLPPEAVADDLKIVLRQKKVLQEYCL